MNDHYSQPQRDLFSTMNALDRWLKHCRDTISGYRRTGTQIPDDVFLRLLHSCPQPAGQSRPARR